MASIDSLNGINKVSDNVYEVVTTVDVGANIDNLENAIFIIKMTNVFNRGKLRFRDGCNTVFTMEIYTDESRTSSPIVIQGQKKGFSPAVYFSIPESVYNTKGEYYFLIKMTSGTESRYLNDELRRISYK